MNQFQIRTYINKGNKYLGRFFIWAEKYNIYTNLAQVWKTEDDSIICDEAVF